VCGVEAVPDFGGRKKESSMAYNNPNPAQSTTLTADERAAEARRILTLLREEPEDDLERKLTGKARGFIAAKWLEMDLGGQLTISPDQLFWLRDSLEKFQ
jgi:hypothetical protein